MKRIALTVAAMLPVAALADPAVDACKAAAEVTTGTPVEASDVSGSAVVLTLDNGRNFRCEFTMRDGRFHYDEPQPDEVTHLFIEWQDRMSAIRTAPGYPFDPAETSLR